MNSDNASTDDPTKSSPAPRRGRGCAGIFFFIMVLFAVAWGCGLGIFVAMLDNTSGMLTALDDFRPKVGSRIYSADGELLGEFTKKTRHLVPLSEIPLHVQKAFIATEDDTFYQHKGVRPLAYAVILVDVLRGGALRGGSTITQQLARNIEGTGVSTEQTVSRKLKEAIVALQLERQFTKDELLEIYLNQIFLGVSAWGVEAAAQQYFAKPCRDLTIAEGALLAGLTRQPNRNEPLDNPDNARKRRDIVLGQMLENGFIGEGEYEIALAESVDESVITPEERAALAAEGNARLAPRKFLAPYFVEEVRKFILNLTDKDKVFEEGMEIETTLDMRLQHAAEKALTQALDDFDAEKLDYLTKRNRENEFVPVWGGLVCLDNRPGYEGHIRAMVGGRDFDKSQFNTVTQAERQPGSSVKPFVWAAAIDNGWTPASIVVDEKIQRIDGAGEIWAPKNFSDRYEGPITLRTALERSVNIVSIKLVESLGMPLVRSYLKGAGFRLPIGDEVGLTLGLGAADTTVLDQAVCFSTLANGGVRFEPTMVSAIKDRDGFVIYKSPVERTRALDENVAFVVTYMLRGVAGELGEGRAYYPSGWRSRELDRPRAGKTGTSNESRNVWFCGYTPDYTCVVWMGYEDNRPLGRGREYTGGRLACPIWTRFMVDAHKGLPPRNFEPPDGVEFYEIDRGSGLLGGSFREAFVEGTKPRAVMPELDFFEGTVADLLD